MVRRHAQVLHLAGGQQVDDADDQHRRGRCMQQHREPAQRHRHVRREPRLPEQEAGDEHHRKADHHQPEQRLLACVVASDRRQFVLAVGNDVAPLLHPLPVNVGEPVLVPEMQGHPEEAEAHGEPHERVQDPRPLAAAEEIRQEEQRRMEDGKARQRGQEETDDHEPVIEALGIVVTLDPDTVRHADLPRVASPRTDWVVRCHHGQRRWGLP